LLIAWRGLAEMWHQKKLMLFLVGYPLLFMLIFGSAFGGDTSPISVDMVIVAPEGGYTDAVTQQFVATFSDIDAVRVRTVTLTHGTFAEEAQYQVDEEGEVVILGMPASIIPGEAGPATLSIFYDSSADPTEQSVALSIIDSVVEGFSDVIFQQQVSQAQQQGFLSPEQGAFVLSAAAPIEPTQTPVSASEEDLSYIDYLVPGLVSMSLLWTGVNGASAGIVEDRVKGIRRRILSTPVSRSAVMLGDMLSQMVVVLIQVVILLLVAVYIYNLNIVGSLWLMFLIIIIGTLGMIGIGLIIASFTKTADEAGQAAMFVNFPMMFLSGIFFPLSQGWMNSLSKVFPLTYTNNALRDVMIRGEGIGGITSTLGASVVFTAVIFIVGTYLVSKGESI
jgi:ABC-2 type transport system permease protein